MESLQNGDDLAHVHLRLLNSVKKRVERHKISFGFFCLSFNVLSKRLMQRFVIRSLKSGDCCHIT